MARVMVVEDERVVARDLAEMVRSLGHEVAALVSTGAEAVEAAERESPELVLMDVRLRGAMDGIEAAERIRARRDVPIVFLTAYADDSTVSRAKRAEPYGYLVKPYEERELASALALALHRHDLERRHRARERWFATTLRSIGDGVLTVDPAGRVTFMNSVAQRMTGWTEAEAVGRPVDEVLALVDEATRAPAPSPVARALRDDAVVMQDRPSLLLNRRGDALPVDDSAAPITDEHGAPLGAVVVFRDVSDRRRLESRLAIADRLASLGTLTAGMAHEINNPLTYVLGNLDYALGELDDLRRGPPADLAARIDGLSQALREALDGAERVRRIVADLKAFSRPAARGPHHPVALEAVVEAASRLAANEVRHRARLVREVRDRPWVSGDEAQLAQVFAGLLVNAAESIPEDAAGDPVVRVVVAAEGPHAVVEVHDTGVGIPPEVMVRIFDPFFTTKPVGQGTGLGLSIAHGLVLSHGGEITAESRPGSGSTFRVTLPAIAPPAVAPPAPPADVAPARPGRILVVDDEPLAARAIGRALEGRHHVDFAVSGAEALARLEAGDRYDVVLCDVMMPGMSGVELQHRLEAAFPDQAARTVFATGGAFGPQASAFVAALPAHRRLDKPIDPAVLQRVLAAFF